MCHLSYFSLFLNPFDAILLLGPFKKELSVCTVPTFTTTLKFLLFCILIFFMNYHNQHHISSITFAITFFDVSFENCL